MAHEFLIVAGEASGDLHAAKLARAIAEAEPSARFFGIAGPEMRASGVDAVVSSDDLAIVGLPEIAAALPKFLKILRTILRSVDDRRPRTAILVDFPEFNLKLATLLKRRGIRVVYYISPQLWAWRKYRIRTIRDNVDLLISILPFEKSWYRDHGVEHVTYVGNPLAREVFPSRSRHEFRNDHDLDDQQPLIALLPGSRRKEITRILPVLMKAAETVDDGKPTVQFLVALKSERYRKEFETALRSVKNDLSKRIKAVYGETYDAVAASDAAAVTSGTATLETGILGTPMVIVYKTSALNYKLMRPLIDVPHFGLINLIAGKRIAEELIQHELTPETLATELLHLLEPEKNAEVRKELTEATEKLGHGGASKRAAAAFLEMLKEKSTS